MSEGTKRGPGRPPGTGSGKRPELRERADAELVAYCLEQQKLSRGFLAGLVERHRLENSRGAKTAQVL